MRQDTAKNLIKKILWMWNYKVTDIGGLPFDLRVSGFIRVKVLTAKKEEATQPRQLKNCDVIAVVVSDKTRFYSKGVEANKYTIDREAGWKTFRHYVTTPTGVFGPRRH
jgi:hypothetical protein